MSDGMRREPAYLSSHATNRYFIPNWGKVFQNRKEFYNDNDIYFPKRITLTPKYRNQDLLYPQGSDVFFSKRVLDAFADEKIVGYDIIKGGCFYCTVETTDEI